MCEGFGIGIGMQVGRGFNTFGLEKLEEDKNFGNHDSSTLVGDLGCMVGQE